MEIGEVFIMRFERVQTNAQIDMHITNEFKQKHLIIITKHNKTHVLCVILRLYFEL